MKKIIVLIAALFPFIVMAQGSKTYSVGGTASKPAKVTLRYTINGKPVTGTTQTKDGKFNINGTINTIVQADLVITPNGGVGTMFRFWLEPGHIKVADLDSISTGPVFSGTPLNDDETAYSQAQKNYTEKLKKLPQLPVNQPANPEDLAKYQELNIEKKAIDIGFIKKHPNSLVSLNVLYYGGGWDSRGAIPDMNLIEPLFNSLSAAVKNSAKGKEYQGQLNNWKHVQIGSFAPDFKQFDQNGKQVNLSDFKGKYILVDFWASWCHPCRWENSNLVKQHQLYKNKNFIILSISMDGEGFGNKAEWLKAIDEDHIGDWPQLADLAKGYKKNEARLKYGVSSIPENFLVDPEGKIIGKSLKGEDLNNKLKEIFNTGK